MRPFVAPTDHPTRGRARRTAAPFIEFKDVVKCYGSFVVLNKLNLTISQGEKLALIGPSGSGKTTILRVLMTLEPIQEGTVWIDGEPLWHMESKGTLVAANERHLRRMRQRIGMVFQSFNLFPNLTAFQNVAEPPQISLKLTKREAEDRAQELLRMVGLTDWADHYPAQLSGGQKQRVAIARAVALRPSILLFDEVTSALDPELVEEVLNVLRDVARTSDATMLLVTHEMSFASEFADRILFLEGGRIVEEGPPEQIFQTPVEERTRSFLRKVIAAGQRLE
jgi:polar amino acid transport system ATP-binding protein